MIHPHLLKNTSFKLPHARAGNAEFLGKFVQRHRLICKHPCFKYTTFA